MAQALPPHKFYGSASAESPVLLNGTAAGDGSLVLAINQNGKAVGRAVVTNGTWAGDIDPLTSRSVYPLRTTFSHAPAAECLSTRVDGSDEVRWRELPSCG